ncbi:alpha/beta hydrolase [Woodsholea maritima]|uniref:alpha/beta hydrolase n=1 Tax=Woodsholea maritima TaxID=240237 RepID=UPI000399B90F|nr:alpha/beta hydrolase [Woodsholea maritima]
MKTVLGMVLATSCALAALMAPGAGAQIGNEVAITFEADSGETTQAFRGTIEVPENRNNPDSRMIELTYVRFAATGDHAGVPIVYLAGGPGGSGIRTAKWRRFPLFMAMRAYGDVIALDQRGTGQSGNGLSDCTSSLREPDDQVMRDGQIIAHYRAAIRECADQWAGADFDMLGYTTVQNVADLEDVRTHFGADKITLWGISYGSHMALAALNQMPERLDKVVIASAEGLDQTIKQPRYDRALMARWQAAIDAVPSLKAQFPDIVDLITRVHARLDAEPVTLEIAQEGAATSTMILQRRHLQDMMSYVIGSPEHFLLVLQLYQALDAREDQAFSDTYGQFFEINEPLSFSPMSALMDMASGISDASRESFERDYPSSLVGPYLNIYAYSGFGVVKGLDLGDGFRQDPVSDIPVLLISGSLDGRTMLEEQRQAVRGLSNLTHIVVEHGGHNVFMLSPEITTRIEAFMAGEPVSEDPIVVALPGLE